MSTLVLLARLGLAATLGLAAVAKLADRVSFEVALERLGLPGRRFLAWVVPAVELVVSGLLLLPASARPGAAGALALLALLTATLARALRRGERPDCGCFGASRSTPIGGMTLVRNGVLAAAAGAVLAFGPGRSIAGVTGDVSPLGAAVAVLALALGALAWFSRELFRQNARLLRRVEALEGAAPRQPPLRHGLPVGSPAPAELLQSAGSPLLAVFADPACPSCASLPALLDGYADADVRVISRHADELAAAFSVAATPSAVLVAADGTIASETATGLLEIADLLERTAQPDYAEVTL